MIKADFFDFGTLKWLNICALSTFTTQCHPRSCVYFADFTMVIYFSKWLSTRRHKVVFSCGKQLISAVNKNIFYSTNMIHKSNLLPFLHQVFLPVQAAVFCSGSVSGSGSGRNAAAGGYSCCHRWQLLPVTRWRTPVKDFFQMLSGFPKTAARLISSKWDLVFQQ